MAIDDGFPVTQYAKHVNVNFQRTALRCGPQSIGARRLTHKLPHQARSAQETITSGGDRLGHRNRDRTCLVDPQQHITA